VDEIRDNLGTLSLLSEHLKSEKGLTSSPSLRERIEVRVTSKK
jgi:hypothetical protein